VSLLLRGSSQPGCGPIGALVVVAACFSGAAEIVATEVSAYPLSLVNSVGATHAINIGARSATGTAADHPFGLG
jgi:threonine dehydrogenase-like Zn-dependent dehydrogenase